MFPLKGKAGRFMVYLLQCNNLSLSSYHETPKALILMQHSSSSTWSRLKTVLISTSPLLIFFACMIWVAFYIMPYSLTLINTIQTKGIISHIDLEQDHGSKSAGLSSLVIHLEGHPNGFFIYRMLQNYGGITNNLKQGMPITIYHTRILHNNWHEVVQLENNRTTLYSLSEYKRKESTGGLFCLAVVLLLFKVTLWQKYKAALYPSHYRQLIKRRT
jgi:hypothetical protein